MKPWWVPTSGKHSRMTREQFRRFCIDVLEFPEGFDPAGNIDDALELSREMCGRLNGGMGLTFYLVGKRWSGKHRGVAWVSSSSLLADLMAAGIKIELLDCGNIRATPSENLTDDLRRRIRNHKPALLTYLQEREAASVEPESGRGWLPPYKATVSCFGQSGAITVEASDPCEAVCRAVATRYGFRLKWKG